MQGGLLFLNLEFGIWNKGSLRSEFVMPCTNVKGRLQGRPAHKIMILSLE